MRSSGNVLVIEDSKFFSQLVCKSVAERTGMNVIAAMTFEEARDIVESGDLEFDLALCDIVLPDSQDGESVEYICDKKIPCIVFTSLFSEDLREHLFTKNIIDYVIKDTPASLDYLLNLVERLQLNGQVKVLVADDSRVSRRYVRQLLELYRFEVIEADGGVDALAAATSDPDIRMVITDYHMPDMDGVTLTRKIRAIRPRDDLAIIGFSAGGGNALSAQFLKNGANDYVIKPFLREEFLWRVTQNIQSLEMMQHLKDVATTDALTGMHNRRFFFESGATMFASAKRGQVDLTLAMMDIDFFKKVNDTYGHDAGDAVLKKVAAALKEECRGTDIVARLGGEEFAVLAVNLGKENVPAFIEKLRAAIESLHIIHNEIHIPITASFGVSQTAGESLDDMLKAADDMLYVAKDNGRNRVEFLNAA